MLGERVRSHTAWTLSMYVCMYGCMCVWEVDGVC